MNSPLCSSSSMKCCVVSARRPGLVRAERWLLLPLFLFALVSSVLAQEAPSEDEEMLVEKPRIRLEYKRIQHQHQTEEWLVNSNLAQGAVFGPDGKIYYWTWGLGNILSLVLRRHDPETTDRAEDLLFWGRGRTHGSPVPVPNGDILGLISRDQEYSVYRIPRDDPFDVVVTDALALPRHADDGSTAFGNQYVSADTINYVTLGQVYNAADGQIYGVTGYNGRDISPGAVCENFIDCPRMDRVRLFRIDPLSGALEVVYRFPQQLGGLTLGEAYSLNVRDGRLVLLMHAREGESEQTSATVGALVAVDPALLPDDSALTLLRSFTRSEVNRFVSVASPIYAHRTGLLIDGEDGYWYGNSGGPVWEIDFVNLDKPALFDGTLFRLRYDGSDFEIVHRFGVHQHACPETANPFRPYVDFRDVPDYMPGMPSSEWIPIRFREVMAYLENDKCYFNFPDGIYPHGAMVRTDDGIFGLVYKGGIASTRTLAGANSGEDLGRGAVFRILPDYIGRPGGGYQMVRPFRHSTVSTVLNESGGEHGLFAGPDAQVYGLTENAYAITLGSPGIDLWPDTDYLSNDNRLFPGSDFTLHWEAFSNAQVMLTRCEAQSVTAPEWSGELPLQGSRTLFTTQAGNHRLEIICQNEDATRLFEAAIVIPVWSPPVSAEGLLEAIRFRAGAFDPLVLIGLSLMALFTTGMRRASSASAKRSSSGMTMAPRGNMAAKKILPAIFVALLFGVLLPGDNVWAQDAGDVEPEMVEKPRIRLEYERLMIPHPTESWMTTVNLIQGGAFGQDGSIYFARGNNENAFSIGRIDPDPAAGNSGESLFSLNNNGIRAVAHGAPVLLPDGDIIGLMSRDQEYAVYRIPHENPHAISVSDAPTLPRHGLNRGMGFGGSVFGVASPTTTNYVSLDLAYNAGDGHVYGVTGYHGGRDIPLGASCSVIDCPLTNGVRVFRIDPENDSLEVLYRFPDRIDGLAIEVPYDLVVRDGKLVLLMQAYEGETATASETVGALFVVDPDGLPVGEAPALLRAFTRAEVNVFDDGRETLEGWRTGHLVDGEDGYWYGTSGPVPQGIYVDFAHLHLTERYDSTLFRLRYDGSDFQIIHRFGVHGNACPDTANPLVPYVEYQDAPDYVPGMSSAEWLSIWIRELMAYLENDKCHFNFPDGLFPIGSLVRTDDGIFGITAKGGVTSARQLQGGNSNEDLGRGTVFRILPDYIDQPGGGHQLVRPFRHSTISSGLNEIGGRHGLIAGPDGRLYGLTNVAYAIALGSPGVDLWPDADYLSQGNRLLPGSDFTVHWEAFSNAQLILSRCEAQSVTVPEWSGELPMQGSKTLFTTQAGNHRLEVICQNEDATRLLEASLIVPVWSPPVSAEGLLEPIAFRTGSLSFASLLVLAALFFYRFCRRRAGDRALI